MKLISSGVENYPIRIGFEFGLTMTSTYIMLQGQSSLRMPILTELIFFQEQMPELNDLSRFNF